MAEPNNFALCEQAQRNREDLDLERNSKQEAISRLEGRVAIRRLLQKLDGLYYKLEEFSGLRSVGLLITTNNAISTALSGDFDAHGYRGINQFIKDHTGRQDLYTGSENYLNALRLAAKAFKGDVKEHLEADPEVKSELAISQAAAAKPGAFRPS